MMKSGSIEKLIQLGKYFFYLGLAKYLDVKIFKICFLVVLIHKDINLEFNCKIIQINSFAVDNLAL